MVAQEVGWLSPEQKMGSLAQFACQIVLGSWCVSVVEWLPADGPMVAVSATSVYICGKNFLGSLQT